jgi:CheY-like chemotaxis protein
MRKDPVARAVLESDSTFLQRTILVVEDNAILSKILQRTIETCTAHRVVHLSDGASIREKVNEHKPDLLLLDYDLPGQNGLDLYDLVHATEGCEHIPAIIISADLPQKQLIQRNLLGLSKPYKTSALLRMLEGLLI